MHLWMSAWVGLTWINSLPAMSLNKHDRLTFALRSQSSGHTAPQTVGQLDVFFFLLGDSAQRPFLQPKYVHVTGLGEAWRKWLKWEPAAAAAAERVSMKGPLEWWELPLAVTAASLLQCGVWWDDADETWSKGFHSIIYTCRSVIGDSGSNKHHWLHLIKHKDWITGVIACRHLPGHAFTHTHTTNTGA